VLMGYAIEKHGLAQRFAIGFLALPGVGGRTTRLTFAYMLIVGIISVFVSDAAAIAMTIPIGMSLVRHATAGGERKRFAAFMTLATLYAAIAGGTATIIGVPHNAIVMAALQRLTGRQIGFFEWMKIGVPIFIVFLLIFYAVLWVMLPPEAREVPTGEAFLRAERAKLGPMTANQRRVLFVFAMMVILFTLPSVAGLALGDRHPATVWLNRALNVWVVPPAVMFLLFVVRSARDRSQGLITWKDAETQSPWNAMLLVTGAVAMTDALSQFGFVEFMGNVVRSLGITPGALPYVAAWSTAITTNFISGTATATQPLGSPVPGSLDAARAAVRAAEREPDHDIDGLVGIGSVEQAHLAIAGVRCRGRHDDAGRRSDRRLAGDAVGRIRGERRAGGRAGRIRWRSCRGEDSDDERAHRALLRT